MKLGTINLGTIWTALTATAVAVTYMFNTFATSAEVKEEIEPLKLSIWYDQYYARLDDFNQATEKGNEELAREFARQMERLKAKICQQDPEWERCE